MKKYYYYCPECGSYIIRENRAICVSDKIYKDVSYCETVQKKVKLKRINKRRYIKMKKGDLDG